MYLFNPYLVYTKYFAVGRLEKRLELGRATRNASAARCHAPSQHGRYRRPKQLARNAKNPTETRVFERRGQGPNSLMFSPMFLESLKGSRRGIAGIGAELGSSQSSLENDAGPLTSGNSKAILYLHWSTIGIDCSVE
jgi:hypothetical protein